MPKMRSLLPDKLNMPTSKKMTMTMMLMKIYLSGILILFSSMSTLRHAMGSTEPRSEM